ncbi:S9 family peptidase [uncultured Sunxiuqinia sp.]|uniref:S9 family peptidase n=1 Tax=uncultured Sunxiuqinia sp. TaxID=1573825 RepID=UPI00261AB03F|nr:S9 family peptidase [uncultured Sunxiuqinia sp.]
MKKLVVLPVLALMLCAGMKSEVMAEEKKTYVPETPKLKSDVMTPEVLWSFGQLGNAELSPDGKTVLYAVTYYHIEENKSYRELYTIPAKGGESKQITHTALKESGAQWRPDGQKIGYLYAKDGETQLWEMNPDGSDAVQITEIEGGITGFKYSPDQKHILYTKAVKLDDDIHDLFPDLPKANARLENDLMYRHWDSWHDYTYNHIFIADYGKGNISEGLDILEGQKYDSPDKPFDGLDQIAWSPDSKQIVYSCKKLTGKAYSLSTNTDLYRYDLETGSTENLTEENKGYDKSPLFSPDGTKLAWTSMARDGYEADQTRLFVMDLKTGAKTNYSEGWEQHAGHLSWSADSKSLFFISNIHATDEIYRLNLKDGEIKRLTDGVHNYQMAIELPGGKLLAQKVSMSQPAELYVVNPKNGKDEPLTEVNKGLLDQLEMGALEERWVKTVDDKDMHLWVIYPPHFDPNKKYPTLLYCQGGPQGTVSQFWSTRWNFQMMAANGYIVVAPNRRGLPGFGMEWLEQISKDYGGLNIQDYLVAIDELAKEPFVDNERLGAVGASYGGFSVNYLAGHHEGRFSAFISHCGIFNFDQMYVTTEEMWFENWDIGGPYWDKSNQVAQRSYSFSPHLFVEKWDTPILVIHGEKDFRIPYTQGMGAFNAAVLRDIPAQFLYFPEENHWVTSAQNGIVWQRVFKQWLDKWLKK